MTISRRCLLLWFLLFSLVFLTAANDAPKGKYLLFVGTYTEKQPSKGIYAFRFDSASSELTPLGLAAETVNPSFLAIDPSRHFLYAVNEIQKYKDASSGGVSAFAIDSAERIGPNRQTATSERGRFARSRPLLYLVRQDGKVRVGGQLHWRKRGRISGAARRPHRRTLQRSFNTWGRAPTTSARKVRTRTGSRPRPTIVSPLQWILAWMSYWSIASMPRKERSPRTILPTRNSIPEPGLATLPFTPTAGSRTW